MSYWYWRKLKDSWAVDEATSNKFDLPEKGHLSALLVKLQATNAAYLQSTDNPWVIQHADQRIVGNGNYEIINMKGRHLQAINFWDWGELPKDNLHLHSSGIQEIYFTIPFGRWIGDPLYGLILEKFDAGVEFEDTNDFSSSLYTDATELYTIYGLFRKSPEADLFSGGFLKKRLIKTRDTASESEADVKLPTENKLRQIHLFSEPDLSSHLSQTGVFTNLDDIYLSVKSKEEYILRDVDSGLFARWIHHWLRRRAHTQMVAYGGAETDGDTYDTMIYERESSFAMSLHTGTRVFLNERPDKGWLERVAQIEAYGHDGSQVDARFFLDSWGICFQGNIPLLLQTPESDKEKWLDARDMADVYVGFDEGASTGNIYVVLDELQPAYPA